MNHISNVGKIIIGAIIIALIIVAAISYFGRPTTQNSGASSVTNPPRANTSPTTSGNAQPSGVTTKPTTNKIVVTAPTVGSVWKIATSNTISWSREGGISGDIYLIDAKNGKFVGVILPQVGPHQTSYEWNTRDLYLSRTSPSKTTVLPGTYIVKVAFDGNNLPIISSPIVTITN